MPIKNAPLKRPGVWWGVAPEIRAFSRLTVVTVAPYKNFKKGAKCCRKRNFVKNA
jgi:hypothetical protein